MPVCSGSGNDPLCRAVAASLRRLRVCLAWWSRSRTHCSGNHAADVWLGPNLPCNLGQPDSLQAIECRTSRAGQLRHGVISSYCTEGQSALDDPDGLRPSARSAVAFPEIHQPRYESASLRGVFKGSLLLADSVVVRRDRASSQTHKAHRQLSVLADLLAPAIGSQATAHAKGLLHEFGSIGGLAEASPEAIERALGGDTVLAAMLAAGRAIVNIGMREIAVSQRVDCNDPALHDYLLAQLSREKEEHLLVLFLDAHHRLIAEELYTSGSTGFLLIRPRKLFSRALALGCHAIVLAHNHPSGDPNPSQQDIDATRRIAADGTCLEIALVDHLVIGHSQVTSMLQRGLL